MFVPDILGAGFTARTLELHDDDEGAVVATLVRYQPAEDPLALPNSPATPRFALLAIHGWNDYFFQVELARNVARAGGAFYAIDLRKYGRSLLDHQTPGYIEILSDYDEDLHAAFDIIHAAHGWDVPLVLYGHSTGGLTAALWAHRHPGALAGLILNSPWLEVQGSTLLRQLGTPVLDSLARIAPDRVLPVKDNGFYQRQLTGYRDEGEEVDETDPYWAGWEFNPQWRRTPSTPITAGWLTAIARGQAQVAKGLDITCPILTLTSNRSDFSDRWTDELRGSDIVLDVDQIWRRVPYLGRLTTLVRIDGAIHDVTLSPRQPRERAFGEIRRWLRAYVPSPPTTSGGRAL